MAELNKLKKEAKTEDPLSNLKRILKKSMNMLILRENLDFLVVRDPIQYMTIL